MSKVAEPPGECVQSAMCGSCMKRVTDGEMHPKGGCGVPDARKNSMVEMSACGSSIEG
jgi:ferredoxin